MILKGIEKSFGSRLLFNNINLLIKKGDRVALLGNNGTGKTTLLKIILGELQADSGTVKMGPSIIPAYLPQIIQFDEPELTILDTVRRELLIDEGLPETFLQDFFHW